MSTWEYSVIFQNQFSLLNAFNIIKRLFLFQLSSKWSDSEINKIFASSFYKVIHVTDLRSSDQCMAIFQNIILKQQKNCKVFLAHNFEEAS